MAINVGDEVLVKVIFYDRDTEEPINPDVVTVVVTDSEDQLADPEYPKELSPGTDVGHYSYAWNPQDPGWFTVQFEGTFNDGKNPIVVSESFLVSEPYTVSLGEGQELVFATDVEPLLVDPEEFKSHFVEAGTVEIMEFIHRYSSEVQKMFKGKELPFIAYEYIRAAVLCSLSKIYDYGVGGDESSVSLGDLSITSRTYPRLRIDRANAANWCELAAALRWELARSASGMKAVVAGDKYESPMPQRHLKSKYNARRRR